MASFFGFFFVSGLCSLVYQVVWLRVAMAKFGVTTPLVSIVLSVFMAGLALGSWGAGRITRAHTGRGPGHFLRLYAMTELAIGISGLAVAPALGVGHSILSASGSGTAWGSASYYLASGAWITLVLLPFCTCMGATFPLAMAAIRGSRPDESARSFSFLYVANVLGAMTGAFGSAFVLIELVGFRRTMLLAAVLNAVIAAAAFLVSRRMTSAQPATGSSASSLSTEAARQPAGAAATGAAAGSGHASAMRTSTVTGTSLDPTTCSAPAGRLLLALLFTTGFTSLAMEVVWTRTFLPYQGTAVYAFATILGTYLAATVIGSRLYRFSARRWNQDQITLALGWAVLLAAASGLLPLAAGDPRLPLRPGLGNGAIRVALGIAPFCGVLGFLTPMVLDRWCAGDPGRAGSAYAVNAVGCILGPLVAGFVLLPWIGERWTIVLMALPLFALGAPAVAPLFTGPRRTGRRLATGMVLATGLPAILLVVGTKDLETIFPGAIVRRDHTATVIATGTGMGKRLLVNGQGITSLTPITKMMAHLPLASLSAPPSNGLVLCFGMGTSFRSMLSWGIRTTSVELVPSVPPLFGFFHADGDALAQSPLARIVVDDARRFLERNPEKYDVVVIDPPPPIEAAGSSMLYSTEFYRLIRTRLKPGGILQQWLPWGSPTVVSSFTSALVAEFPYVRAFVSVEGWGMHFLASDRPIPTLSAAELAGRLPAAAARDLIEWGPSSSAQAQLQAVLARELVVKRLAAADPNAPVLTDDRPVNEYYWLRGLRGEKTTERR